MVQSSKKHHDETAKDTIAHETAAHEVPEAHDLTAPELHLEGEPDDSETTAEEANLVATVAAVGVVGIGVAVVEAALLPGVILGVAAMAVPKLAPKLGSALGPIFKSSVRGLYRLSQKTREFVAETQEHVQDIVAEVDAEAAPAKIEAGSSKAAGAPLQ
jgi:hypothetical protein